MGNLTQRWIQLGTFFQNQGTLFDFQKRAVEASPTPLSLPPLPLVARLNFMHEFLVMSHLPLIP